MKGRMPPGAMPANVSVRLRAIVIAGFAKDEDDVNQYAAPMNAATDAGTACGTRGAMGRMQVTSPEVATSSPSHRAALERGFVENCSSSSPNIACVIHVPAMAD